MTNAPKQPAPLVFSKEPASQEVVKHPSPTSPAPLALPRRQQPSEPAAQKVVAPGPAALPLQPVQSPTRIAVSAPTAIGGERPIVANAIRILNERYSDQVVAFGMPRLEPIVKSVTKLTMVQAVEYKQQLIEEAANLCGAAGVVITSPIVEHSRLLLERAADQSTGLLARFKQKVSKDECSLMVTAITNLMTECGVVLDKCVEIADKLSPVVISLAAVVETAQLEDNVSQLLQDKRAIMQQLFIQIQSTILNIKNMTSLLAARATKVQHVSMTLVR